MKPSRKRLLAEKKVSKGARPGIQPEPGDKKKRRTGGTGKSTNKSLRAGPKKKDHVTNAPAQRLRDKMKELEQSITDSDCLLNSTGIAVVFIDREFCIRNYTPAARDLFVLADRGASQPLDAVVLKFADPSLSRDIEAVLKNAKPVETEVFSDSGRAYVRRVLPYHKHHGPVEGVVLTFVDISARKAAEMEVRRSESTHRLILKGIKEYGIFVLGLDGRFVTWTAGAETILGYSENEVIGKHFSLIHTDEDRRAGMGEKDLAQAGAGSDVYIARWHVRKDGSKFWGTGILSILNNESGRPYGFVKVVRDNTDRKLADDALHHAMQQAEAANASKDHFLANVSHELRTPLSATLLWSKLLIEQKEIDPEMLREGLNAIARSSKEQQVLIEDLMDTAKIVAGKLRLETTCFVLNALIETFLPSIRTLGAEKSLVIETELGADVGTVEADSRRIQQVISNLLNNAIKFTPNGGRIKVRTVRKDETVEIRVLDTGKGIKREFLSRIFERFVQLDQGSTPTASGMGLGLAICKQLVELHHGTISAESQGSEQGAVFIIKLPLVRRPEVPESFRLAPAKISLSGLRIMMVEDTAETRHALGKVLVEAGADVVAFGSAKAALAEFDRRPPHVILSDIGLDGMSGHQLIAEIRRREREKELAVTPAVALTAYADDKNIRTAFESGFQDCLTKPVEPTVLLTKLYNLAGSR